MKTAIPRKIINSRGSLEKDDWLTCRRWRAAGDKSSDARNLEIVEPADKSTFEALGVEISEHGNRYSGFGNSEWSVGKSDD